MNTAFISRERNENIYHAGVIVDHKPVTQPSSPPHWPLIPPS